jgi:ribonuclease J
VGPFDLEYIPVAHSIPESYAIVLRTPLGTVVHTGDWKLDDTPTLGPPTDRARLEEIGREGVLALVCDSTNALREGRSPSESDVARELEKVVAEAKARVAFTTFASNVGRTRSIALAAAKAGRNVVIVGRALRRALDVAGEIGLLEGLPPFLGEDAYAHLPRDKVVAILTGSQGEPRAALARAAEDDHPVVELSPGDLVVFSSRPIPGNEIAINRIANSLIARGIHVITDRDRLVHASGHPRRDELAAMYEWVKPQILVPVHGEAAHLAAQAEFGRRKGIKTVLEIRNGTVVRLAPSPAVKVDDIAAGRLYKDGRIIGNIEDVGVPERRRLAFAGQVSVSVVLGRNGEIERDPDIALNGLPRRDGFGRPLEETVMAAVLGTLDSIPKPRRRDAEMVREAIRRAVRAAIGEAWGKKPNCTVFVAVL